MMAAGMGRLCKKRPVATLELTAREVAEGTYLDETKVFAEAIRRAGK